MDDSKNVPAASLDGDVSTLAPGEGAVDVGVEDVGSLSQALSGSDAARDTTEGRGEATPPSAEALKVIKLQSIIDGWFYSIIHGSAVSRNTEAYNHLVASLPALRDKIVKEF